MAYDDTLPGEGCSINDGEGRSWRDVEKLRDESLALCRLGRRAAVTVEDELADIELQQERNLGVDDDS